MLKVYVHTPHYVPVIKHFAGFPAIKQPTFTLRPLGSTIILTGCNWRGRCKNQIIRNCDITQFDSCKLQLSVPAFLKHTVTQSNSSCRWSFIHIWQQLQLWAHLFRPRWNREVCCCFNTDLLFNIFYPTLVPQRPKSAAGFSYVPPNQTEWPIKLAQGEQMSTQITSFTLSYTPFPLRLCVLASATSLTFLLCSLHLYLLSTFLSPSVLCPHNIKAAGDSP